MRQLRKMAGIMRTIKNVPTGVAVLPLLPLLPVLMLFLLSSIFSAITWAHDPGLSMVDIDLTDTQLSIHITYAKADIEQFIALDKDHDGEISNTEFAEANTELRQFIVSVIEFSNGINSIKTEISNIKMDKSNAVHFTLLLSAMTETELTIYSRMIDQFALGHRQFVKVKTAKGLISSRILSARDPVFKVNLPRPDLLGVFTNFMVEGIWHILIGFDHILFVITLLLPAVLVLKQRQWFPQTEFKQVFKETVKVISAFTIAHSLTLGLTVFKIIKLPEQAIESMIAASVIIAAANNIFTRVSGRLWLLAFVFGLIHGMGFAVVLTELGLPRQTQILALTGFNLGVELGQLAIIAIVLPGLYLFRKQNYYQRLVLQNGSYIIAVIATVWLFERVFDSTMI